MGDLGKLFVAKGFKKLPKVQSAQKCKNNAILSKTVKLLKLLIAQGRVDISL